MAKLLVIKNNQCLALTAIPKLDFSIFREQLLAVAQDEGQVVQFFAFTKADEVQMLAILRQQGQLLAARCLAPTRFASLTAQSPKFHLFEREMAEQYGLHPEGHPWLKMVRYHPNYTHRDDVFGNDYHADIPGNYPVFRVEGENVHEVAVGPVHAGIIEPGHFRFQCGGERVFHLEIQLGYQHRGVEQLLETVPLSRLPLIAETIAGDTSIGHVLCQAQALEALAGIQVTEGSENIRALALELERIANHVGDLGALNQDVAFAPPAAYLGRIRGEYLNLSLILSGNRFGRGLIRPGGVTQPLTTTHQGLVRQKLTELTPEVEHITEMIFSAPSVLARFDGTGIVSAQEAEQIGLVGFAGRASGQAYDVRTAFPFGPYHHLPANKNQRIDGDVCSRAKVRGEEISHATNLSQQLLANDLTPGPDMPDLASLKLTPNSMVVTLQEAWRGEVSHCLLTDDHGQIDRYKIKDPSFHNWQGLALALRDEEISEFPLCNKSFNLSYCGFDL